MKKIIMLLVYILFFLCACDCSDNTIEIYCIDSLGNYNKIEISEKELKDFEFPILEYNDYYFAGWYYDELYSESASSSNIINHVCNNKLYLYAKVHPAEYINYYHLTMNYDSLINNYWSDGYNEVTKYLNGSFWYLSNGEYIPYIVKSLPIAVNADSDGLSTIYNIELRTDCSVAYNLNSSLSSIAGFKGRPVNKEDYITSWRVFYNQNNGLIKWNSSYSNHVTGLKEYYEATKEGFSNEAWKNVGVELISKSNCTFLQVEFEEKCDVNYVIEYLLSSAYSPVSSAFINCIGGEKNYCKVIDNKDTSIFDTMLFVGPYIPTVVNKNEIVIQKNSLYKLDIEFEYEGIYIQLIYD